MGEGKSERFYFWNVEEGKVQEEEFGFDSRRTSNCVRGVGAPAMCFAVKDLICVRIFRCLQCKNCGSDGTERCPSYNTPNSPVVRLRKFSKKSNAYELFSDEMGSNRTGEVNCKVYSEGREILTKGRINASAFSPERNGTESGSEKSRQSSQTPEYVKRTAKLFESVKMSEEGDMEMKKNEWTSERYSSDLSYSTGKEEVKKVEGKESRKISLDCLDGDFSKKPSYVGVSCSNSGYRNVINYDSKLREGFWTANSQRESLVLSSSRLRESSPLRRDFDFRSQNGTAGKDSVKITDIRIERETNANGVSQPEKFVNISTSTKTISTFRNSKDNTREEEEEDSGRVNGVGTGSKVNLRQILTNGKGEETHRKGYSNLGFNPKILKSPEKNCNSFLKSISSFENNCRKSDTSVVRSSTTYSKSEQRISRDSSNSILQRIERLYGPGALAQGFYTQKPQFGNNSEEPSTVRQVEVSLPSNSQTSLATPVNSNSNNFPNTSEAAQTETVTNGHVIGEKSELEKEESEKDGHHFLKLLKKETDRLEELARFAESELENGENLPEEASGKLRAAAGKARLLVCQKLHQFEGLCHKNLNEKPGEQFPTTREDLAGFWDMVMLQVVQVYGVFEELEELKKNNWIPVAPTKKSASASPVTNGQSQSTKTTPKRLTPTTAATEKKSDKSESAKKAREEGRRKMLEERRRKMKELKENKMENEVEIFAK